MILKNKVFIFPESEGFEPPEPYTCIEYETNSKTLFFIFLSGIKTFNLRPET